jgi:choline kinase
MADYNDNEPSILYAKKYPTREERSNFYRAYLKASKILDLINNHDTSHNPDPSFRSTPTTEQSNRPRPTIASIQPHIFDKYWGQVVVEEAELVHLDEQVTHWLPAVNAMWPMCALIQATEMVKDKLKRQGSLEGNATLQNSSNEFDYLVNAKCRIELFRQECRELGVF